MLAASIAPPPVTAAGITGLYIDGFNDPLSDGAQTLYEAPAATVSVSGGSSARTVIVLVTSVDGWTLTFGTPGGPELHTGSHQGNLVVERAGHTCELWGTDVNITELTWAAGDVLASFAADFDYGCQPQSGFTGVVRYNAASPIKAMATSTVDVELGPTEAGEPGPTTMVTVTNIGHVPVAIGAPSVEGSDIAVAGGTCAAGTLPAGASCTVGVRLTGSSIGLGGGGRLLVGDETRMGARNVLAHGDVWSDTVTTLSFDPKRQWAGGQMFVGAAVTPAPGDGMGGSVTITYTTDGGDPVSVDRALAAGGTVGAVLDVPRGDHTWSAVFHGANAWRESTSASVAKHTGVATLLAVAPEVNPVTAGDPVVLNATLSAPGFDLPQGIVTFRQGAGPVLATDAVGGPDTIATATLSNLALGVHDITASYATTEDGSSSSDVARVFVATHGIEESWAGLVPMTDDAQLILGPVDTDGAGVYVAGTTIGAAEGETSLGAQDIVVARFDALTGVRSWVTQLGSAAGDQLDDLEVTPQGVFITGSSPGTMVAGGPDGDSYPFLARLALDGSVSWVVEGPRRSDDWLLAAAPDGGVFVAGTAPLVATPDRMGAQVRRYSPTGSMGWEREIASCCWAGKAGNVEVRTLASDAAGLLVGGWSFGSVAGGNDTIERGWLRRLTAAGSTRWTQELKGAYGSVATEVVASNEAAILATGLSTAPIAGQPNAAPAQNTWMRRIAYEGTTTWTKALTRTTMLPSCRTFVATTTSEALPSGRQGGTIAELRLDGTDGWRYEHAGTDGLAYVYEDAAIAPGRAYVVEHVDAMSSDGYWRVVSLSGIPAPTGCDTGAPTAGKPTAGFVTGSHVDALVPVKVTWSGSDTGSGIARYELLRRVDGGAWTTVNDGLAGPALTVDMAPGVPTAFRGIVVDRAGNRAGSPGPTVTLRRIDDRSTSIRYSSGWRSGALSTALSGTLRSSTTPGATASISFTGRAFAWVAPKGASRGAARVYLDGRYAGTVNLYRSTGDPRGVVFTKRWTTSDTHTVSIRVVGTSGHARVDIDALLVLR